MDPHDGSLPPRDDKSSSDHSLLKQYRSGSQDAATDLYRRYAQRLRGLARAQLSGGLARQVEVDDIVQSVFGSFFRGVNEALYDVPAGEELWKLLLVIALHKIRAKGAYHLSAKRDIRRAAGSGEMEAELASRADDDQADATLLRIVIAEALERLSPPQRQLVELRMDGLEILTIAEKTGRSKRTVERLLQQARTILTAFFEVESQHDNQNREAPGGTQ